MLGTMKSYKAKPSPPQNTLTKQNAAETILYLGVFSPYYKEDMLAKENLWKPKYIWGSQLSKNALRWKPISSN